MRLMLPMLLVFSLASEEAPQRSYPSVGSVTVDRATGNFVDRSGRSRIFHGFNAVEKLPPYFPSQSQRNFTNSLTEADADQLASWGTTVIRLGVLWNAVVPSEGRVDAAYLDHIQRIVDMLAARGIYTLLDMHQDVMGSRYCGEGLPDWLVNKIRVVCGASCSGQNAFPAPHHWDMDVDNYTGFPARDRCAQHNFFDYYKSVPAGHPLPHLL